MRQNYKVVFPEVEYAPIDQERTDSSKVYKIKYTINLMPICAEYVNSDGVSEEEPVEIINPGISLSQILSKTSELDIFKADGV